MSYIDKIFNIQDKIIVVTGASSGIGAEIAKAFCLAGANVLSCARSPSPNDDFLKNCYTSCDITDSNKFSSICENLYKRYGKIDVLINAAGISKNIDEKNINSGFVETISTNLIGTYNCINIASEYMTKGGSIINITSIGAHVGFPNNPSYIASKFGLSGLSKALAIDLAKKNIRVNNIAPGYIKTKMTIKSYNEPLQKKIRTNRTILNRWGNPNDLIGAAIFLASDSSNYITGTDIIIDGGWLAKGL